MPQEATGAWALLEGAWQGIGGFLAANPLEVVVALSIAVWLWTVGTIVKHRPETGRPGAEERPPRRHLPPPTEEERCATAR